MNRKPVLALDADGVVVDFSRVLISELNQRLKRQLKYHEMYDHNAAIVYGVSEDIIKRHAWEIYDEVGVENLPAIRGAIQALRALSELFSIAIITSRVDRYREGTSIWFARRRLEVSLHFSQGANNPYAGGDGRSSKPQIAAEIHACCLVDDNPHEFVGWPQNSVEPICFARPWNRTLKRIAPGIPRLRWHELVSYVRER